MATIPEERPPPSLVAAPFSEEPCVLVAEGSWSSPLRPEVVVVEEEDGEDESSSLLIPPPKPAPPEPWDPGFFLWSGEPLEVAGGWDAEDEDEDDDAAGVEGGEEFDEESSCVGGLE